jgi:phosphatidylinositol 3-kinase
LKSVTWSDAAEARQAVEVLLPLWTEVGIDDALELLGPGSEDGRVRAFAVKQMARADDEVSFEAFFRVDLLPLTDPGLLLH